MNKESLVNEIVKNLPSVSRAKAERAVSAILGIISEALTKGEKVTLSGFGTFYVSQRQARKGTNPRTKEPLTIPAASVPKFRPGEKLKKVIR